MKLVIKNMVCARCVRMVKKILTEAGIEPLDIELGEAIIPSLPTKAQLHTIKTQFLVEGFELLDDKQSQIVERIKNLVISEIQYSLGIKKETDNFSKFLSRELGHDYSFLSKLFSSVEGITIEKYIIAQKIERVKEWLIYDELSLQEIAYRLGYSSSQYLSNQFKQVTGMSPTTFKQTHSHERKHLDRI